MSIADAFAGIALGLSATFGGPFFDAKVIDQGEAELDDGGSIVDPGEPIDRTCSAQIDACTEAMRSEQGYADKDVRLLILRATIEGGLDTDAMVEVLAGPDAGLFSIQSVGTDPMAVYWECRARPA